MAEDDREWLYPGAEVIAVTERDGQYVLPRGVRVLQVGKRHVVVMDQRGVEQKFLTRDLTSQAVQRREVLRPVGALNTAGD